MAHSNIMGSRGEYVGITMRSHPDNSYSKAMGTIFQISLFFIEATPQCYISEGHFATKLATHYLWYWTAAAFSFFTALTFLVSSLLGKRLSTGFFWIGFPIKENGLLRLGPISLDSRERGNLKWGYSVDITISRRTISFILPIPVQYFDEITSPQANQDAKIVDALKLLGLVFFLYMPNEFTRLSFSRYPLCKVLSYRAQIVTMLTAKSWAFSAYMALVVPVSVVRFRQFRGEYIGPGVVIFVSVLFALTGLVEFLLFVILRPAFGVVFDT